MLASKYDSYIHNIDNWYISYKYDGVRGLWSSKDMNMYSRNGNKLIIPEFLKNQLISIDSDLDGELFLGNNKFEICSGLVRKKKDIDVKKWSKMMYMVFDIPDIELTFEERLENLKNIFRNKFDNVKIVKQYKIKNYNNIYSELTKVENRGIEGLMLRNPKSHYAYRRSNDLLKLKTWNFDEAIVIGYDNGSGKYEKSIGALIVKSEKFGEFRLGSGLNDLDRKTIDESERKRLNDSGASIPIIGSIVTFKYMETTNRGKPRIPIYVCVRDYE